jgi:hypothetical protein
MSETINSFFTIQSVGTLAGASAAVVFVSNTYRILTKSNSVVPPFIISIIVSFVGAYESGAWFGITEMFLVILNGCLLFCSALGVQETTVNLANRPPPGTVQAQGKQSIKWFSSWFNGWRQH